MGDAQVNVMADVAAIDVTDLALVVTVDVSVETGVAVTVTDVTGENIS